MPAYKFRAVDNRGKGYRGVIAANDERELFNLLQQQSHHLISYRLLRQPSKQLIPGFNSITRRDLINFCLHMEQMDRAGIPILDSLKDARDSTTNSKLQAVLVEVFQQVKGGSLLSAALRKRSKVFDSFFIQVIAVSEETGRLYQGFEKLIEHLKWLDESHEQIVKAVRYPIIVACVVIGVLVLLMQFLLPQLTEFILASGSKIPPMTKALIKTSEYFVFVLPWLVMTLGLGVGMLIILRKLSSKTARTIDKLVFYIPLVGKIYHKIAVSRFIYFFNITFSAGIDTLQCLQLALHSTTNQYLYSRFLLVGEQVNSGLSLSQALHMSGVFSTADIRIIKVGEDTGKLGKILQNLHYFYERDISRDIERYVQLLEPALFLAIGAVMIWIVIGIFYPIYDHLMVMDY